MFEWLKNLFRRNRVKSNTTNSRPKHMNKDDAYPAVCTNHWLWNNSHSNHCGGHCSSDSDSGSD